MAKRIQYSKYKIGELLVVDYPIDGFRKGEIVKVVNNIKVKKQGNYSILVKGARYKDNRYIRTDFVKRKK